MLIFLAFFATFHTCQIVIYWKNENLLKLFNEVAPLPACPDTVSECVSTGHLHSDLNSLEQKYQELDFSAGPWRMGCPFELVPPKVSSFWGVFPRLCCLWLDICGHEIGIMFN